MDDKWATRMRSAPQRIDLGVCIIALPFVVRPDVAAVSGSKNSWEVKGGAESHLK